MLIYGRGKAQLKSIQSIEKCPRCDNHGTLKLSIRRGHAHIFWIPLFPFFKKGEAECQNCSHVILPKEMSIPMKLEYDNLKNDSKGPIWQFSGLVLIIGLILWFNYNSKLNTKKELEYLASPIAGDVYEYEVENGMYSTLKLDSVSKDSLYVIPNSYELNKRSKLYTIDNAKSYAGFSFSISREQIQDMYKSGDVFSINRD